MRSIRIRLERPSSKASREERAINSINDMCARLLDALTGRPNNEIRNMVMIMRSVGWATKSDTMAFVVRMASILYPGINAWS
jgi:hypothetical protein